MKTALIAGATGLTGKKLLFSLLNKKEYSKVFILVRSEIAIKDSKLTQIVFNFDNAEEYQNLPDVDEVFCCLGTTIKQAGSEEAFKKVDLEYPVKLAEVYSGKKSQKFIIITALGADVNSRVFYNRVKGATEKAISSFKFESIYICRPSLLLGERIGFRLGEEIGKFFAKFISRLLFGSLRKYRAIEASVLAEAMVILASSKDTGIMIVESDRLQLLGMKDGIR